MFSLRSRFLLAGLFPTLLLAQEVCNNGIDDDADGLIDLNDTVDCPCSTILAQDDLDSYIRNHSFEEQMCCPYGFVAPPFTPPWLSCADGWQQATQATSDYFHECGYSPVGFNLPPPDGEGAVGFYAGPGYFEYVGTCLTYPEPANPLLAGVTYTLSLWISAAVSVGNHTQTPQQADPSYFVDQLPLAIFGHANECVSFPVDGVSDCIGFEPGWTELGRVMVQPAWDWTRVSITFTPAQEMHTIMIGGACDVPSSFSGMTITNPQGDTYSGSPFFVIDELLLTIAQDQLLAPVVTEGSLCGEDARVVASPPQGATNHQWYVNGVALPGQTGTTLNVSQADLGSGVYTMSSSVQGECLMGSSYVPPPLEPTPQASFEPMEGCAPLTVQLADTTKGSNTIQWQLGDGTTAVDSALVHTYTVPGSYDVELTVRNTAGCTGTRLFEDAVIVHPPVSGQIAVSPNPAEIEYPVVTLTGTAVGDVVNWWWDLGEATPGTSNAAALSATFPAVAGDYPVLLAVSSANGCVDTVRSIVRIIEPGVIEMPNVFSPNGDGNNDRFTPILYNGTPALLEIYNRWGQEVFATRALEQGWSGGGVPDGTYYFVVTPDDQELKPLTGHVTLVR